MPFQRALTVQNGCKDNDDADSVLGHTLLHDTIHDDGGTIVADGNDIIRGFQGLDQFSDGGAGTDTVTLQGVLETDLATDDFILAWIAKPRSRMTFPQGQVQAKLPRP